MKRSTVGCSVAKALLALCLNLTAKMQGCIRKWVFFKGRKRFCQGTPISVEAQYLSAMNNKRLPKWIAFGVTFSVAITATASILTLRRWADNESHSTLQLTRLQLLASRLDSLEWQIINAKQIKPELQEELNQVENSIKKVREGFSDKYSEKHRELRRFKNEVQHPDQDCLSAI
jgi:hypothetical protein